MKTNYASINVIELAEQSKVVVSKISVSMDGCVLAGGWVLDSSESMKISSVIQGSKVIPIGPIAAFDEIVGLYGLQILDFSDFFLEAKNDVEIGKLRYEQFKAEDTKKRKNLVTPDFFDWPSEVDLNSSAAILESMGIVGQISGTANEMKKVMPAARLTKFYIDNWLSDESERKSKKFVNDEESEITVLPKCWLN